MRCVIRFVIRNNGTCDQFGFLGNAFGDGGAFFEMASVLTMIEVGVATQRALRFGRTRRHHAMIGFFLRTSGGGGAARLGP